MKLQTLLEATAKKAKSTVKKATTTPKSVNLEKVAEDCRSKLIGSRQSKFGDCEPVSIAIAKSLFNIYPDIKIIDGFWHGDSSVEDDLKKEKKDRNAKIPRGHVWCFIPSKNLIVDGTHDQFNKETRVNIIDSNHEDFEYYSKIEEYRNISKFFSDPEFKKITTL